MKVDEITDTTAQLSWTEGTDSHSPVISYAVQARTPFSVGWQTVTTGKVDGQNRGQQLGKMQTNWALAQAGSYLLNCSFIVPEVIDGKTRTATVVELNPWVEYEFRVVASNKIGGGEPSLPSEKVRTEEAGQCFCFLSNGLIELPRCIFPFALVSQPPRDLS